MDLDRYCNLLRLDLDDIMAHPQDSGGIKVCPALRCNQVLVNVGDGYGTFDWLSRIGDNYF